MTTIEELRAVAQEMIDGEAAEQKQGVFSEFSRRASALARAYLAEHPADDGDPVTADWLDSLTRDKESGIHWRLSDGPRAAGVVAVEVVLRPSYCTVEVCGRLLCEWWPGADDAERRQYTRGRLRRLCAALGVPLTDPK